MGTAVAVTRSDHTALELRHHASRSADSAQVRRLLALASVVEGRCRGEAAALGGMDRQTLRDWIHRYNEAGIEGLKSRRSPGRAPALSAAQMAELKAVVLAGPDPAEHKVVRWRCVDLQAEVARRFAVEVHESTVGRWLHELGLTGCNLVRAIPGRSPGRKRLLKKLRQPADGGLARPRARRADRDLVPGRGQGRPEGNPRLYLGADRLATADGAR